MKNLKLKTLNATKKLYLTGAVTCFLLFSFSMFQIISYYAKAHRADMDFAHLGEIVERAEGQEETPEDGEPFKKYRELFHKNNEMAGWISIDGTKIHYPVMHTPDNPDYYLNHSFEKKSSAYGVPYIAEHCNPFEPSDNVIIYGHHMKDGTMFAGLLDYENKSFYQKHKIIHFDTLTKTADYEVMAVFKSTVYDDQGFLFDLFADAETEEDFRAYTDKCKSLALYDTGVDAEYGDKLITLSTCEYSQKNGRLAVVAKKVTE